MEKKIFIASVAILLVAAFFDVTEAYELTETETQDWCQFYSELAGEFHQVARSSYSKDEFAVTVADYIRQLDEIALDSDWTNENRETWLPEFQKLADVAWELRNDLTTEEVSDAAHAKCIEDQSEKGEKENDVLRKIQSWIA